MLKTLLKKQLFELNRSFFYDSKKGTLRSKASSAVFIILYVLLMVGVLGGIFFALAKNICYAFVDTQYDWLYYTLMKLIAVMLGVFGSVFNTYASLYKAKDNDMLLSMPIPAKYVLAVRLVGVYAMSLMYSAVVMIPTVIVYFIYADLTVSSVVCGLLSVINVSVFVLVLSCIFGWAVAKVSDKLKKKSFVTVAISLLFFAAYYYVYMNAYKLIESIIENVDIIGSKIKGTAYPLYLAGRAGAGDILAMAAVVAVVIIFFMITYYVIEKSFISIATASDSESKTVYREKKVKRKGTFHALLFKESSRFFASPTYMLNCGLGTLFLLAAGIVIIIKSSWIHEMLLNTMAWNTTFVSALAIFAICTMITMNDISAPSVSMEGKSIWITQSLPVTARQVVNAKFIFHLLMTLPPVLFCSVCACVAIKPEPISAVFIIIVPALFALLLDSFGLAINLKKPNLNWTSEAVAVKQSMSIFAVIFGGWAMVGLIGVPYLFLCEFQEKINPIIYLTAITFIIAILTVFIIKWIRTKGTEIFETL